MGFVRLALLSVALGCATSGCTDEKTNTPEGCGGCCIDAECGTHAICVQHICVVDFRGLDFSSLRDMAIPLDAAGSGDLSTPHDLTVVFSED